MAAHAHHHGSASSRRDTRRLGIVLSLTVTYMVVEAIGGLLANSLALLADAGHMLTDNLALALALFAARLSRRPPDPVRTFGYQRAEILAALINGIALLALCGFIVWEAAKRFQSPVEVQFGLMAAVAAGGLLVNLTGVWILHDRDQGLNVRAAYLHVLGDLLGSVGALTAAGLIALFGWYWADPAASVVIAGIIVFSSVRLLLRSVHVLMEGAPAHLDASEIRDSLATMDGIGGVHDLHLWSLGGRVPLLTAHLVTDHSTAPATVLRDATRLLRERYGIEHVTLQVEPPDFNIVAGPAFNGEARRGGGKAG
jgi:cobalt-zinc-cadmium efflux system protein